MPNKLQYLIILTVSRALLSTLLLRTKVKTNRFILRIIQLYWNTLLYPSFHLDKTWHIAHKIYIVHVRRYIRNDNILGTRELANLVLSLQFRKMKRDVSCLVLYTRIHILITTTSLSRVHSWKIEIIQFTLLYRSSASHCTSYILYSLIDALLHIHTILPSELINLFQSWTRTLFCRKSTLKLGRKISLTNNARLGTSREPIIARCRVHRTYSSCLSWETGLAAV